MNSNALVRSESQHGTGNLERCEVQRFTPAQARLLREMEQGATLYQTPYSDGRPVRIFLRMLGGDEMEVRASLVRSLIRRSFLRMKRFGEGDFEWGFERSVVA